MWSMGSLWVVRCLKRQRVRPLDAAWKGRMARSKFLVVSVLTAVGVSEFLLIRKARLSVLYLLCMTCPRAVKLMITLPLALEVFSLEVCMQVAMCYRRLRRPLYPLPQLARKRVELN